MKKSLDETLPETMILCFLSPSVPDASGLEPSNIVDVLDVVARSNHDIAKAIRELAAAVKGKS